LEAETKEKALKKKGVVEKESEEETELTEMLEQESTSKKRGRKPKANK
jgi:hypothetical protein